MGHAEPNEADVRIGSRDSERIRVFAPVEVRAQGGTVPVLICDLSASGARIEAQQSRFQPGQLVRLRLPLLPVEQPGEIVRTTGTTAGLKFCEPLGQMEVRLLARGMRPPDAGAGLPEPSISGREPADSGPEFQVRTKRANVAIGASCRTAGGRQVFVTMIDLTPEGCCLYGRDLVLAVGQKISLEPECRGGLEATVKWTAGPMTGVSFERVLHPFMFAHLAATYPWPLSELARDALRPGGHISGAVLSELTRLANRAEIAFRERSSPSVPLTAHSPVNVEGPGPVAEGTRLRLAKFLFG